MTSLRRLAAVAGLPCAAVALTGCAKTIKESDVESKITQNIAGQLKGTKVDVDCPGGKKAEKGESFACTARIGGKPASVDVKLLDDEGKFSFSIHSAGKRP
ncbi:MAG: hypothetical protein JWP18_2355 [Solirubrobacterales bacterium]|jgi:hypothetical protein|nr:hypothetical protein [Solirubrobacterales bacterium]